MPEFIQNNQVKARLVVFEDEVASAQQAAEELGVVVSQIVKSLVAVDETSEPFLLLLCGDALVDWQKASAVCKVKSLQLATPKQVLEHTGYDVGGVPPISLFEMKTVCDTAVMAQKMIFAGGGDPFTVMEIAPAEIQSFVDDFTVADIAVR
ncbi:MAG: YbaK/EbsC family protein [Candidatus Diapherotrites archaeon]|nr:YbaK/EbsC family protein [Candidatus Diapherotrites archaeon]